MTACRAAERVVAIGTTTVRALESAAATGDARRAEPSCSSTAIGRSRSSTPWSRTSTSPGRRCWSWSTPSSVPAGAASTTTPSARATGSSASATPCSCRGSAGDAVHRRRPPPRRGPGRRDPHGTGPDPDAVLHARRHPGRGAHPVGRRPGGPRRRDHPGQHLPPDAQARAPSGSAASAASTASRTGRATCSPTPAGTRCSPWIPAATCASTTTASRSARPTTAAPIASRRRRPSRSRRVLGSDIQMVLDVCRAAPVAARRAAGPPSSAPPAGRPSPAPTSSPTTARAQPVRHPPGGHGHRAADRERRSAPWHRLRRLRRRWALGGRVPRGDARDPGRHPAAPARRPAPVPHGPRRPHRDGGGHRPRHRPVRLRPPQPLRPPRHDAVRPRAGTT